MNFATPGQENKAACANRATQNANFSDYFGKNEKTRPIEPLRLTSGTVTTKTSS
jgi:hypothetical protein